MVKSERVAFRRTARDAPEATYEAPRTQPRLAPLPFHP